MKKITVLLSMLASIAMLAPAAMATDGGLGLGNLEENNTFRRVRSTVCVARNVFRRRFRARAFGWSRGSRRMAARRAVRKCRRLSRTNRGKRTCRVVRCRRVGSGRW